MNIKDSYCMQGQHFVKDEDITFLLLPTGKKRRMCQSCVDKTIQYRKTSSAKRDVAKAEKVLQFSIKG